MAYKCAFFFKKKSIYFCLCCFFIVACRLSLVVVRGAYSLVVVQGLLIVLRPHGLQPTRLLCPWNSPYKNTGVGCHFLLQRIFLTWEWNLGLPHCRQILLQSEPPGKPFLLLQSTGIRARGLLAVVAHGLNSWSLWAPEHGLSSCGAQAQLPCGMWDFPGPGIKPVSLASQGGFLTIESPGKPKCSFVWSQKGNIIVQASLYI